MAFEKDKISKKIKAEDYDEKKKGIGWCRICNGHGYHCNKRLLTQCPKGIVDIKDKNLDDCRDCPESVLCYECKGKRSWIYNIPDNDYDWKSNAIC